MGVLNLTPDSFSDGGKYKNKNKAYNYSKNLIRYGVDIIDVGGESTRPGANQVSEKEEWKRRTENIFEDILKEVAVFND